jgi:hypothetical protein
MAKYVVYSVVYICINVNPGHVFKIFTWYIP